MKAIAVQFRTLVHIAGEPVTNLLVDDKRWGTVLINEDGVLIERNNRTFLIPKQNITCVEYVSERIESPGPKVVKGTGQKKQKRGNRPASKRVIV